MSRAAVIVEVGLTAFTVPCLIAATLNPGFRRAVIAPYRRKAATAQALKRRRLSCPVGSARPPNLRPWGATVAILVVITVPFVCASVAAARAVPTLQLSVSQERELGVGPTPAGVATCPSALAWLEGRRPSVCTALVRRNALRSLAYLACGLLGGDLFVRALRRRRHLAHQWLEKSGWAMDDPTGTPVMDAPESSAWMLLLADAVVVLVLVWAVSFTYEVVHLRDTAAHRLGESAGGRVECTRRFAPRMTCWVPWHDGPYIAAKITVWATGIVVIGKVPKVFFAT